MKIEKRNISEITPYEKNPRHNDQAVEAVANSIREFGFKVPIVLDKDGVIVAGHTRVKAAKQLGMTEVPCIVADDLTPEQVKAFRLADNKTAEGSQWDFLLLGEELDSLLDDFNMEDFGFAGHDLDDFGTAFDLPDGDRAPFTSMTFALADEQAAMVESALNLIESYKTNNNYGNENGNGNKLYAIIKEWLER